MPEIETQPDAECLHSYAEFLESVQEMNTHIMTYKKGEGRFALVNINDDNNPELLVIARNNNTQIYTYNTNTKSVEPLQIADGGTDIVVFKYDQLKFGENNCFTSENDSSFTYYELTEHETYEYAVSFYAYSGKGNYYCNTYSTSRMCTEGFDYRQSFENNRVSSDAYNKYLKTYGFADGEYSVITEDDLHSITPDGIAEILL